MLNFSHTELFQEWLIPFHDNFNSDNEYQHDLKETRVFRDYLGTVSLGLKLVDSVIMSEISKKYDSL